MLSIGKDVSGIKGAVLNTKVVKVHMHMSLVLFSFFVASNQK